MRLNLDFDIVLCQPGRLYFRFEATYAVIIRHLIGYKGRNDVHHVESARFSLSNPQQFSFPGEALWHMTLSNSSAFLCLDPKGINTDFQSLVCPALV